MASSSFSPSRSRERPAGIGPRFVISIDYGTTYTGAAWAVITDKPLSPEDVKVVSTWPGGNDPKVPSLYTYYERAGRTWGFEINDKPNVIQLTKLKLQRPGRLESLETLNKYLEDAKSQQPRSRVGSHMLKTPSDTMRDYLTEVAKWVCREIKRDPEAFKQAPIDLIITHPGIGKWDERAKNATFRAATEAFDNAVPDFPQRTWSYRLVTEPEACAQYTMSVAGQGIDSLRRGECFIVVDAGGGTVDLVAYVINSVAPKFDVSRVTEVSSARYGATCIDEYFLNVFLREKLGQEGYEKLRQIGNETPRASGGPHIVRQRGEQIMLERFQPIKHRFAGRDKDGGKPSNVIILPDEIEDEQVAPNGQLTITYDDMEDMFKKSVNGTLDLIEQQIAQIQRKNLRLQTIFLSGGFSESKYLFRRVKELCDGRGFQLLHGTDRWTAVAKGAVLMGLQLGCWIPPPSKKCPFHVGVVLSQRFMHYEHHRRQRYTDSFDDVPRGNDNVKWVISKGDLIAPDEPISKTLRLVTKMTQPGHRPGSLTIVTSTDSDPNGPTTRLSKCEDCQKKSVEYDFSNMSPEDLTLLWRTERKEAKSKGGEYHVLEMQLRITNGGPTDMRPIVRLATTTMQVP